MKLFRIPLTTLAALTLSIATHAQTADEIVSKHIEAIGGRDNINALKSAIIESEIDIMGNPAPGATTIIFDRAQLSEINFNGTKIINCVTIDKGGWTINPMAGSTSAEPMPDDQVKTSLPQLAAGGILFNYAANVYTIETPTGMALKVSVKKVTIDPTIDPKIFDKP